MNDNGIMLSGSRQASGMAIDTGSYAITAVHHLDGTLPAWRHTFPGDLHSVFIV
ncbi:hypothetical protein D3C85_1893210 [compost metagenome]